MKGTLVCPALLLSLCAAAVWQNLRWVPAAVLHAFSFKWLESDRLGRGQQQQPAVEDNSKLERCVSDCACLCVCMLSHFLPLSFSFALPPPFFYTYLVFLSAFITQKQ